MLRIVAFGVRNVDGSPREDAEAARTIPEIRHVRFAAAQASAVAASAGTSANAKYQNGVAVFTLPKGGLMAEASVGGQKFGFEPFAKK